MMMKKNLVLLLVLMLLPMVASAHDFEASGVFYNIISLSDLTVEVTSGSEKYVNTLDIPQFVQFSNKEFKVVRIGKNAFLNCVDLKKVNLPNTMVQIGDMTNINGREDVAFSGSGITEITIPSSVIEIDNCAFNKCTSLSKVIIEDGQTVLKLGCGGWLTTWKNELSGLFAHASVREAYIGRNLDYNVHYDDYNCDYILPPFKQAGRTDCSPRSTITTVTFGDMVTEIPVQMFSETPSIKYVSLGRNIKIIKSRAFFNTAIEVFYFNNSLETIENEAFASCKNLTTININKKVNIIGDRAFENCTSLSDVTLGNGLKYLSNNLFAGCTTLKSISIPANIKSIGEKAFSGCTSLSNIVFNSEILTIGDACFENCNFMALKLPEGLSVISKQCFKGNSSLIGIELPNSLIKISEESFAGCSKLEKISVPSTVNIIGDNCFSGTNNLRIIKLYNQTPPSINENSFANLNYLIATLYVPDNSVEIYKNTEIWASFNSILPISKSNVKKKLTYIVDGEEYKIYEIETGVAITLEPTPKKEGYTFSGWSDIPETMPDHDVTVTGSFTVNKYELTYKVDGEIYKTYDIEYGATITPEPAPTREGYTFSGWSEIPETMPAHDVTVTSTFTASVVSDFKYKGIKYSVVSQSDHTVEVAASNQSAGSDGPASYSGDIVIPSTVSYGDKTYTVIGIGQSAFVNCVGIASVSLTNTLTYIRKGAFSGCTGLTSIAIPNSVTSIDGNAFSSSLSLTSISVESGNTKYDSRDNCNAIIETSSNTLITGCKTTTIPNSVTSIGDGAFLGCSGLTSMVIPNSVTSIGDYAFCECTGLTSIAIPNSVTSIGLCAFSRCSGLTSIAIPNTVTSIGWWAFSGCRGLTSINIPNSVTSIGAYAFFRCSGLTSVTCLAENVPTTESDAFGETPIGSATLYVPAASLAAYQSTAPWSGFGTIEAVPDVTDISELDNVIYVEPAEVRTGTEAVISLKMKNSAAIRGFQFDLYLPAGVTAVKSSKGKIQATLSAGRLPDEDEHTLAISEQQDGAIRFLCGSQYNETFTGTDGEIATLKVSISEDMEEGDHPLLLKNIKLTESDISKYYETELIRSKLTVLSYIPGDVNRDGVVDVSDYIGVANHILGDTPSVFLVAAADVNGDKMIDVSDYIGVANIILTGSVSVDSHAMAAMRASAADAGAGDNAISLLPLSAEAGSEVQLSVQMRNSAPIRGFQFRLSLPDGVTVARSGKGKLQAILTSGRLPDEDGHTLSAAEQSDGTVLFLCGSQYDEVFTGSEGEISTITLRIPEDMSEGVYPLQLKDMKLTESDISRFYEPADSEVLLSVRASGNTTGINAVREEKPADVYDLSGRKVGTDSRQLPKGVYIINNKKVVIK